MYLEIFLADFAVFRVFLGISRDFAEKPEFRESATARSIRSPVMTSFIIPSPSILNNWRRGGMTALAMGSWQIPLITVCSVAVHTPKSWKVKKSDYWQAGKNNKPWQKKAYRFRLKAVILFWTLKTVIHMGTPEATTLESATCIIKAFNARILMRLNKLLHLLEITLIASV